MAVKYRCRQCGSDYPEPENQMAKTIECEICEDDIRIADMRVIIPPRVTTQADPLDGM